MIKYRVLASYPSGGSVLVAEGVTHDRAELIKKALADVYTGVTIEDIPDANDAVPDVNAPGQSLPAKPR